ncbi:transcriptional regulator, RpiR family [Amphibacillus marinus]|uniref:Transcriptional regulator, RpiR family n=1 Tax=Amphibacillus marinus TaxID=872970 RepID=A0A1H8KK87_9BACI|nr:MurR/RpiR family transcriptional regulator [Amphibacillus marinus]SEN93369.1 transcriptional regulator, RpiR family [Amphibacillus marinus]
MMLSEKMTENIFSTSEQAVITYMFDQREGMTDKTIKQIADDTYTHPSTLIRVAKKLGFNGWIELKDAFLNEIAYLNSHFNNVDANFPFDQEDNLLAIANKIALLNQTTIQDTLSLIKHGHLQKATSLLEQAKEIKIFAMNNNLILCHDFKSKMTRVHKNIRICSVDPRYEAANSDENTCAIVISYSGETDRIISLLPILQRRKASIIALTSIGENTLTNYADCIFRITTREKLISKIDSFSSNTSICFLLDILYASLFSLNYQENLAYKIQVARYFDHRHSTNKVIQDSDEFEEKE